MHSLNILKIEEPTFLIYKMWNYYLSNKTETICFNWEQLRSTIISKILNYKMSVTCAIINMNVELMYI